MCGVIDSETEVACNRQIDKAFFKAALSGSEPDLLHPHSKKELGFLRYCIAKITCISLQKRARLRCGTALKRKSAAFCFQTIDNEIGS